MFAATSLTGAFDKIGAQFEKANPGVKVTFNYDGSSTLATSIVHGAPADVFASAAPENMKTVTDENLTSGTPETFTSNKAEIMVETGNPKTIKSVNDLAEPDLKVVVCAPDVPCGALAQDIFKKAGVAVKPASEETSVGGVVTKMTLAKRTRAWSTSPTSRRTATRRPECPSRRPEPVHRLPDRTTQGRSERGGSEGLHRLRDRAQGAAGAGHLRLPAAGVSGMDRHKLPFNPLVACLAALAVLFFVFPLIGLLTGAPWGHIVEVITSKTALDALGLSLVASLSSTVIALVLGFPLAWMLARGRFRGKGLLRGLTTLPMVLPPVVGGIALLLAFGRRGIIGERFEATGFPLPFTTAGVVVAESFVAMPFLVITVEAGSTVDGPRLRGRGRARLGASRATVFRRVTLPLIVALPGRRHGAGLGPGAGRVRRHHHLRRQPPGWHPDHAARRLPRARDRPDGGHRPEPRAARRVASWYGRAARPWLGAV